MMFSVSPLSSRDQQRERIIFKLKEIVAQNSEYCIGCDGKSSLMKVKGAFWKMTSIFL